MIEKKVPILYNDQIAFYRLRLTTKELVNNDSTIFDGTGDNYFMIFDRLEDAIEYINTKGSYDYKYEVYNSSGYFIDSICLWNNNLCIKAINQILEKYQQKNIFNDGVFKIGEMSSDLYLNLILDQPNNIYLDIKIADHYIEIQIDQIVEAFDLVVEDSSLQLFESFIKDLLTSTIKVECKGKHNTRIFLLDKDNSITRELVYKEGIASLFFSIRNKQTSVYKPILI